MSAPNDDRAKRLMAKPVSISDLLSAADWCDVFEDATGEDDDECWSAWRVAAMLRKEAERRQQAAHERGLVRSVVRSAGVPQTAANVARARRLLKDRGLV